MEGTRQKVVEGKRRQGERRQETGQAGLEGGGFGESDNNTYF